MIFYSGRKREYVKPGETSLLLVRSSKRILYIVFQNVDPSPTLEIIYDLAFGCGNIFVCLSCYPAHWFDLLD